MCFLETSSTVVAASIRAGSWKGYAGKFLLDDFPEKVGRRQDGKERVRRAAAGQGGTAEGPIYWNGERGKVSSSLPQSRCGDLSDRKGPGKRRKLMPGPQPLLDLLCPLSPTPIVCRTFRSIVTCSASFISSNSGVPFFPVDLSISVVLNKRQNILYWWSLLTVSISAAVPAADIETVGFALLSDIPQDAKVARSVCLRIQRCSKFLWTRHEIFFPK